CSGSSATNNSPASTASAPSNASSSRWRQPLNVMLAQGFSPCSTIVARPCASSSSAWRNSSVVSRRGRTGGQVSRGSNGMAVLVIGVHEMFHPFFGPRARLAAVPQVEHETRIAGGEAAELRRGHPGAAQEDFDLSDEHGFLRRVALESVVAREILLV